ncbi:hypothetical protein [Priestia koreensis]|uniref:pPIWI-associating nuclease domain-containing protein n=1 Tax=Priestia koreensis TaxID=284581 RepID=UPI00203C8E68|nr:hypothetical protein [Priestia koreensis]MCM3003660.1 hypothetical protein [Priestia koreensis]
MRIKDDIVTSILSRLENDFQKDIIESSIVILKTPDIKTKFSNFATNIRELTREVFHTLAPDDEVKQCEWYEKGESDITRVQRMTYAIKGGLSDQFIEEELEIDFNEITSKLNKVINNLNKYTHINQKVYYRDEQEGYQMVENTLMAFNNFLLTIDDIRSLIVSSLEERLYFQVSQALANDVIQEVDILATHYLIEGEVINNITITKITSKNIFIDVQGFVEVEHQYGSDRDFTRGDGVRFDRSYPFQISLILDINDPLAISIEPDEIKVDNSSHFE